LVLPTTYASALLLLLLSLFCLGLWPSLFKRSGPQWRFELFYFDFAVGVLLLSVIAAFTFGTFGSEMAFSDRMLVAGRSAQAWAGAAGFLFNLGNMLFLAAISLVGITAAFPLAIGLALIIESFFNFRADNILLLVSGVVLLLLTVVLDGTACRLRDLVTPKAPASGAPKPLSQAPSKKKTRRTTKGIVLGLFSGIPLGLFYPVFTKGVAGDFGLGPYAGLLLFSIGMMLSTIVFNFYFMNIAIEGGAIQLSAYFRGNPRQHFLGFAAGAMWATGALAAMLAFAAPSDAGVSAQLRILLPLASAIVAMLSGLLLWREFRTGATNARLCIGLAAVFFTAALVVAGMGLVH
jgi:glucose uptake protein